MKWGTLKTCQNLALLSCVLLAIFTGSVKSSPQRIRKGYNNNNERESRHHQVSLPDLGLSRRNKVTPIYGEQLQNLDQPFETPNYDFKYQIHGGGNYFGHEENRLDYRTQGSYHVLLPDGRRQVVKYYADETGYHPTITYEFVGVPNSSSSNLNKPSKINDGYRSKRSRYYKHSKRVHLKHPMSFKNVSS